MNQELINSLFIAGIALLSSLLSFLLASIFQLYRDERNRKWQKEDLILKRRLETVNKRINDAQEFLDYYLDLQNSIIHLEFLVVNEEEPNEEMIKISNEIFSLLDSVNKKHSNVMSFGDEELVSITSKMSELINSEYQKMTELMAKRIKHQAIDRQLVLSGINFFKAKGLEFITKVGKRLDELSGLS